MTCRQRFTRKFILMLLSLVFLMGIAVFQEAHSETVVPVTVRLTVLKITDLNNDDDSLSEADFFVEGKFNAAGEPGKEFSTVDKRQEGHKEIHPNWQFTYDVPAAKGAASIDFKVIDWDDAFNGDDDLTVNKSIDVSFGPCKVSIRGSNPFKEVDCGRDLQIDDRDQALVRVEVLFPPSAPGLVVRCLPNPLVPKPGDTITIVAEALDETGGAKVVDNIRIDFNDALAVSRQASNTATATIVVKEERFRYRCSAGDSKSGNVDLAAPKTWPADSEIADTAPREFRRAGPHDIAIRLVGVTEKSYGMDLVFVPDDGFVTSSPLSSGVSLYDDPAFHSDLSRNLIPSTGRTFGLYDNVFILRHQNQINLWIAKRTSQLTPGMGSACNSIIMPEDWDQFSFADVGIVIWTKPIPAPGGGRDCAPGGLGAFSANANMPPILVHEAGHMPFGLADEYDGDGGYWQSDQNPNVFSSLEDCRRQAPTGQNCRTIVQTANLPPGVSSRDWYTSDPPVNDVMVDDTRTFNRLDVNRVKGVLDTCKDKGGC